MKQTFLLYYWAGWLVIILCYAAGVYFNVFTGEFSLFLPVLFMLIAAAWGTRAILNLSVKNKVFQQLGKQAERDALRAQVNSGFLYETLEHLYRIAYPVNDELANGIADLTRLMRYKLNSNKIDAIPLHQEVDCLNTYLTLARLRFTSNFFVKFETKCDIANQQIEPLILLSLAEHALEHGVLNDVQRPVKIQLSINETRLNFMVSSKISHTQSSRQIAASDMLRVRQRLALAYPGRHELLIADNGQSYKATLTINL